MEKEYYYLDGKDQKGPFNFSQLQELRLSPETLIWTEGISNWTPVKELPELEGIVKKIPPPPPSPPTYVDNSSTENDLIVSDSNIKFWVTFKIFIFSTAILALGALIPFIIISNKKHELKEDMYSKINYVMGGKTVILDGSFSLTQGTLEETGYKSNSQSNSIFQSWWEKEKLYTIFKATQGGFTVKQLTKQYPDGYDIETYSSGDMGYKKPKTRWVPAQYYDNSYGGGKTKIRDGYSTKNYRPSVRECYSETYKYFTDEDRKSPGAYSPGKYIDISNFPNIRNEYYYMSNSEPKQYTSSGTYSNHWYYTDDHGANINTEDWAVYYSMSGRHYVITENRDTINEDLMLYIGISVGSVIFILIVIGLSKPKYFRNLRLYGKRWKNTSNEDQILFFNHSFFKKNTFTEILNERVVKGVLKTTDRGNTINLSYADRELFFKILEIDKDNLKFISTKDKGELSFIRVGAETRKEENNGNSEEENTNP